MRVAALAGEQLVIVDKDHLVCNSDASMLSGLARLTAQHTESALLAYLTREDQGRMGGSPVRSALRLHEGRPCAHARTMSEVLG